MLQYQELNRMGGDRFHAGASPLTFSHEKIDLVLAPGETREGSFTIFGQEGESISGFVSSSRVVMQCLTTSFSGSHEIISYRFSAAAFQAGDTVDGYFRIISDHGEYSLPFDVKIMAVPIMSSIGAIRNLYHFTNLAKTNWREALEVFYKPGFAGIFTASDGEDPGIYRGLSVRSGSEQNMEEFLIATGKKQAAEFIPNKKEIALDLPAPETSPITVDLTIRRSGWGYTSLQIISDAAFAKPDRNTLTADDFREGGCTIKIRIDPERLHTGLNLGQIRLLTGTGESGIPVRIRYCVSTALKTLYRKEQKSLILKMMRDYESFRLKKLSGRIFIQRMEPVIQRLQEIDRGNPVYKLYKIHYLLTARKKEEADWEMKSLVQSLSGGVENLPAFSIAHFENEDDITYCYRMYLTILGAQDSEQDPVDVYSMTQDAVQGIEDTLKRDRGNFWIAWFLMYASDAFRLDPEGVMLLMERQYEMGCRSPLLYLEGWQLISQNPAILMELDEYVLETLLYAAKKGILGESVMTQVVSLARREKRFSRKLFEILKAGYAAEEDGPVKDEILESICQLLIRGNMTDSSYFTWYQAGVERQLQVTRLFEYYMLALPEDFDGEIPRMVVMYFAYQSSLPYERNAYLYRYLVEHAQTYAGIYEQYEPQIERFIPDQLMHHRMNQDLAWLFGQYLESGRVFTNEIASAAVPAAFTCMIRTTDRNMKRVILMYDQLKSEQYYPMQNGVAYIPVYGEKYHIFFEDNMGARYAASVPYTCDRMMDYRKLAEILAMYSTNNAGFDLYLSGLKGENGQICERNAQNYLNLVSSPDLMPREKARIRSRLLAYYHEADLTREMDALLMSLDPMELDAASRAEAIEYMVARGLNEEALSWVRTYSAFHVDGNVLVRLCSQFLDEEKAADDPVFAEIIHETFLRGKYDQALLEYMGSFFDGLTSELEAVREAAAGFGADDFVLCRRILIQMLYTGAIIPERELVIDRYIEQGPDETLLTDVLAQESHFYFVEETPMSSRRFDMICRYGIDGVPLMDICRIAWLKDRSERAGEITDIELEVTGLFLSDLLARDIKFPFFRQFIGLFPGLTPYADRTMVEYRASGTSRSGRIMFHYAMEKNGTREKYESVEMRRMYESIYVSDFLIFFGEQMHYYITDDPEEKNVVESGTLGQDARIPQDARDRFGMINRISMLIALGRDEEAMDRIEKYVQRSFLAQHLFESS